MKKETLLLVIVLVLGTTASADFDAWHNSDKWDVVGDAILNPQNTRRLIGKPGTGVLINGKEGKCPSLVSKRRDYRDVEVHVEFMVAKGSNSGVIFHGNHEIQIQDSYGIRNPNAGHCGGVYPRAESTPTYHHIDKGSPPRINAARRPGRWQTMDITFQAARFDKDGSKTAHARFVKVVHNGVEIQRDVEVPYACGPNWDRKQYPQGPVIIQGDYGPIAVRNLCIKEWNADTGNRLNVPPEGFTAIFNGKDFSAFRIHPKVEAMWSIEDGTLKSHGLLEQWGADLATRKTYKDFVLLVDFRMPTESDSGIHFRKLIPEMGNFGQTEQINLGMGLRMGQLESIGFMRANKLAAAQRLNDSDIPRVKRLDPKVGQWHTLKITMIGRTLSAELDGQVMIDQYEYPEWLLSTEPQQLRFQKHRYLENERTGKKNPCPIEYRNVFVKALGPDAPGTSATSPQEAALPQELPLWGTETPAHAFVRNDKEQVRFHKAQPGSLSGLNRAFSAVSMPTYMIHRPAKPNGVGLVICPGGGFRDVWIDREGHDLALWLKTHGVTSLVLKYRMRPSDLSGTNAWQDYQRAVRADGQQAIRILRQQAKALGLRTDKIGMCGFSAGGYLAILCALNSGTQPQGQISGMPDFAGLFYPGIPDEAIQWVENCEAVCPMFIVNARVDKLTPAPKCVDFYAAMLEAGTNAELHVFGKGGHGFGMGQGRGESTAMWPKSFVAWLQDCVMLSE